MTISQDQKISDIPSEIGELTEGKVKCLAKQLPDDMSRRVTGRNVLATVLGTLSLVAIINASAILYLKYFSPNRSYTLVRQKWEKLLGLEKPVDWLILGDSSGNQGVIPTQFEEQLGGQAINLGTVGNTLAVNDAWMLSEYIEQHGAPKNVVIVHVYDVWRRDFKWSLISQIPLPWGFWNELEPAAAPEDREAVTQLWTGRYFPLYSQNKSLNKLIREPGKYAFNAGKPLNEKGFMAVQDPDPKALAKDTKKHLKRVKENDFELSNLNQRGLEKVIELANQHNFNLYLVNAPICKEVYEDEHFTAYLKDVQSMISSYADQSDNVHYVMQSPMAFAPEYLESVDHLTEEGAKMYTDELIQEISAINAG